MSAATQAVVDGGGVILPPKADPRQKIFRWPPDLIEELHAVADQAGYSDNEAGELLMRWALERAKEELRALGAATAIPKKKRQGG